MDFLIYKTLEVFYPYSYPEIHEKLQLLLLKKNIVIISKFLNNVEDGGNTTFPYFDLTIKPEKGKLLIWPAEWTHTHCGEKVHSDVKYIMTGWIDMVD